ncbi:MAG: leucine-rich repeat protein [Oscillospiraceae bacterium]|nr:leucine-rich repeat protein [Oscillospiraceae bacterium]
MKRSITHMISLLSAAAMTLSPLAVLPVRAEDPTAPLYTETLPVQPETDAPAEETEAPAEETDAPAEETDVPAEETEAPAEETDVETSPEENAPESEPSPEEAEPLTQAYYAAEAETQAATEAPTSGSCGEHLNWQFDADTGMLTISGYGAMENWSNVSKLPWKDSRDKITGVSLPKGLTSIGNRAFIDCPQLLSVTVPDTVTSIGEYAFSYCEAMESLTLSRSLTSIGEYAFYNCKSLTAISLPDSLTTIDSCAFYNCWKLETVTVPDSVTELEYGVFSNCAALTAVHLPSGLTQIPGRLFYCCHKLQDVNIPDSVTWIGSESFYWCDLLEQAHIPEGVTFIGEGAFDLCEQLSDVTIPESVTEIGGSAFDRTPWLKARIQEDPMVVINGILICASVTGDVTVPDGVTKIADSAFFNSKVESVTIPQGVTSIGGDAFYWCSKLTSVTIPDSVTELGQSAFGECTALTSITLPGSIKSLPLVLFEGCSALCEVTLEEGIEEIGYQVFDGCTALTSITLPESLRIVRSAALVDCSSLAEVTVKGMYTRLDDYALPETTVIYGYEGSLAQSYAKMYDRQFVALFGSPAAAYTYEIIPLLPPFNEYFFVRTDNPDPKSFRFADKETVYSEEEAGIEAVETVFADVQYDDAETLRVNGGYLFKSSYTDGGTVTLQLDIQTEPPRPVESLNLSTGEWTIVYDYDPIWADVETTFTLPELYDDVDYLIHTYAAKDSFFDNMDAVQEGFSSICLYSGSYIRGTVERTNPYWFLSNSAHADQAFYIQSPYRRQDNQSLFATAVYPFRYDSLGFPSMMGSVAKRLDSTATTKRNSAYHAEIDVTYNGETRSYGGQGNGSGQGIDADMISHVYTFRGSDLSLTLDRCRAVLDAYAALTVEDDVPQDDRLTWEQVCDTVGDGAWVRMVGMASVYGGTYNMYAYLYRKDDRNYFSTTASALDGSLYWSGSLGYASDAWVDGRYLNQYEAYVPGAVFADHPTADIILNNVPVPTLSYDRTSKYNSETGSYEYIYSNVEVTETRKTVRFVYKETEGLWKADSSAISSSSLSTLAVLTEQGLVDAKYLDALELTPDEVAALGVDRNTNLAPYHYYLYDNTAEPGTERFKGDVNADGVLNVTDVVALQKRLLGKAASVRSWRNGDMDEDKALNVTDLTLLKQLLLAL